MLKFRLIDGLLVHSPKDAGVTDDDSQTGRHESNQQQSRFRFGSNDGARPETRIQTEPP